MRREGGGGRQAIKRASGRATRQIESINPFNNHRGFHLTELTHPALPRPALHCTVHRCACSSSGSLPARSESRCLASFKRKVHFKVTKSQPSAEQSTATHRAAQFVIASVRTLTGLYFPILHLHQVVLRARWPTQPAGLPPSCHSRFFAFPRENRKTTFIFGHPQFQVFLGSLGWGQPAPLLYCIMLYSFQAGLHA